MSIILSYNKRDIGVVLAPISLKQVSASYIRFKPQPLPSNMYGSRRVRDLKENYLPTIYPLKKKGMAATKKETISKALG